MKKLAILLTFAIAAASSDAVAADPPAFGPRLLMDSYEMPSGPLTDSAPASEPVVVADPVEPPGRGAAWLQTIGDFMGEDVDWWQRPAANAYGSMADSLGQARRVTGKLNRHNIGDKAKNGRKLIKKTRRPAKQLSKFGEKLDAIDKGGAAVSVLTALYYGDTVGAVQEGANWWLSGAMTTSAGTAGVWVGGVFGSVVAGPPGAMVFGTAGGILFSGVMSFAYDETVGESVNEAADDYAAWARDGQRREQALQRARDLVAAAEGLVRHGHLSPAEDKARQARNALVVAGQGGTSTSEYDAIRALSRRIEKVLEMIDKGRHPERRDPTPSEPPKNRWTGTWTVVGGVLNGMTISITKGTIGYDVMPDHGLPKDYRVRGIYVVKGTGPDARLESNLRFEVNVGGKRAGERLANTIRFEPGHDRLILHFRKFEFRNGGLEKQVQNFKVLLHRK